MNFVRPDSPIELANGNLACRRHRLVICGNCTVDYSFMQENSEEDGSSTDYESSDADCSSNHSEFADEAEARSNNTEAGPSTGMTYSDIINERLALDKTVPHVEQYKPANSQNNPQDLFLASYASAYTPHRRFLCKGAMLIYTDGACVNNGSLTKAPRAGCGFVYRDPGLTTFGVPTTGSISFRLEDRGPSGELSQQTSNRAELRAVIAALQYRVWYGPGEKKLVIATDSQYIVLGVTDYVHKWSKNGWRTKEKKPVKNQDLWQALLTELKRYQYDGMDVKFWWIPRKYNLMADAAAKQGATKDARPEFCRIIGLGD